MNTAQPVTRRSNRTHYLVHQFHITAREHAAIARALNGPENEVKGDCGLVDDVMRYVLEHSRKD